MKKFLFGALMLLCVGFRAVAQDVPAFDGENADAALAITVADYADAKDLMILVDQTNNEPKNFYVYIWDKKKGWEKDDDLLEFKSLNDTARFGRYKIPFVGAVGISIKKLKYITIVPVDGKKYDYKLYVKNSDLYAFIQQKDSSYATLGKDATEIDISNVNSKASDNIKFISATEKIAGVGFYIFGDKGEGFELIGTSYLKEKKDSCSMRSCVQAAPSTYSKIAIVSTDGNKYTYSVEAKSKDLYINVAD